jgi:hypothetical protein
MLFKPQPKMSIMPPAGRDYHGPCKTTFRQFMEECRKLAIARRAALENYE